MLYNTKQVGMLAHVGWMIFQTISTHVEQFMMWCFKEFHAACAVFWKLLFYGNIRISSGPLSHMFTTFNSVHQLTVQSMQMPVLMENLKNWRIKRGYVVSQCSCWNIQFSVTRKGRWPFKMHADSQYHNQYSTDRTSVNLLGCWVIWIVTYQC